MFWTRQTWGTWSASWHMQRHSKGRPHLVVRAPQPQHCIVSALHSCSGLVLQQLQKVLRALGALEEVFDKAPEARALSAYQPAQPQHVRQK